MTLQNFQCQLFKKFFAHLTVKLPQACLFSHSSITPCDFSHCEVNTFISFGNRITQFFCNFVKNLPPHKVRSIQLCNVNCFQAVLMISYGRH